jgi:hypothetical protein
MDGPTPDSTWGSAKQRLFLNAGAKRVPGTPRQWEGKKPNGPPLLSVMRWIQQFGKAVSQLRIIESIEKQRT